MRVFIAILGRRRHHILDIEDIVGMKPDQDLPFLQVGYSNEAISQLSDVPAAGPLRREPDSLKRVSRYLCNGCLVLGDKLVSQFSTV